MKQWVSYPRSRRALVAGAAAAAVAVCASLAVSGTAHATLAPGTPLKTGMAANGNRYFGSDMTGNLLSQSNVTQLQAQQFSMLTPGNEMKWDTTEPSNGSFNFGPGDQIVQYAHANGERYRGHNLVWDSQLPSWVTSLPLNQVQAAMETHITTEVKHYATITSTMPQTPYAWDVVNEPLNSDGSLKQDVFFNAMGSGYIADALKTAHAADPNAKLYINDFNIEGMSNNAKASGMFSLAQSLLAAGAPLNGIGFESHFIEGQIPADMQANMQRFANLGLDVAVTELDDRFQQLPPSSAGLQQQATDFTNVVKDCLGVTRCVGVTQWAIGDADSWIPGAFSGQGAATLFDQNYAPKPAFTALQNLLGGGGGNTVTVNAIANQSTTVNTAASLQVTGTDSGGAALTFTAANLPTGLSISSAGLISGTPTATGTFSPTVTAKDSTGATGSASFTWTINPAGGNKVTVNAIANQSTTVNTAVSLQVTGTDSGGAALTFTAANLPTGLSISSSGLISGTPTATGTSSVTVTAKDSTNATGSASFTWTVNPASGGGACHVVYTRNSEWPGNFTAQVVISNTGTTAVNGWTLKFTYPGDQKVTQDFNGTASMSGEVASLVNANYNGSIPVGGSVTVGFQGTFTSNDTSPTSGFTLNGATCN
jgi:endo-1,4-beta-xylanase